MLSYTVKAVFFGLSISGLVCCWTLMLILSRIINSYFLTIAYCAAITVLEVSFCLGMIWKMDTTQMPVAFCQAQTILLSLGSFMATGVIITFTQTTAMTVFRRGPQSGTPKSTIEYRHSSLLWIIAFPLIATSAFGAVVVKLDAAKPEDMHCDANSPEWVRFLGYAGVPLLLAIPAFFVSVATAFRLFQTHRTIRAAYFDSSRARSAQISGVVAAPAKTPHYRLARAVSPHPVNPTASLSLYSPSLAGHGSPMARGNMPLPASPLGGIRTLPPLSPTMQAGRALSILSVSDYHDDASVYDNVRPPSSPPNVYSTYQLPYGRRPVPQLTQSERDAFSEAGYDMKAREKIPESPEDDSEKESLEVQIPVHASQVHPCFTTGDAPLSCNAVFSPPQSLMPAIWRLALFQIAFFGIETLAALSTIIDVATKRETPMELGTQHFALLLAAWGPFFVFGHLPAVRSYVWSSLLFWKK